jgi:hypothetical protein
MPRPQSLFPGDRNGRLRVTEYVPGHRTARGKIVRGYVVACCDCGERVHILITNWKRTASCGCYREETAGAQSVTHGMSGKPEYQAWRDMLNRCYRSETRRFERYGGRGIRVCAEWRESFEAFLRDVGPRPEGYTLGRKDNDGHYEPGNVRWETREEQGRNKRNNVLLTYRGRTQCLKAWAEDLGVSHSFLRNRHKRGWSDERVLTEPAHDRGQT